MATISNTPRPGYVWDSTDNVWYPIGTGPHTHADYITSGSAINPTIVDAKGDIIAATAADTVARLAVGANDTVLTADSSTATGLKWAVPSGGANWTLLNTGGTALTGAQTITVSGISGKDKIMVIVDTTSSANASSYIGVRLNTDTGNNYYNYGVEIISSDPINSNTFLTYKAGASSYVQLFRLLTDDYYSGTGCVTFSGCNSAGVKTFASTGSGVGVSGQTGQRANILQGYYNSASTISSISVFSSSGNFDLGTVYVYTSA